MIFIAPILAIFLLIWVADTFYFTPKEDLHVNSLHVKEKNESRKSQEFKEYFEKNIKK